MSEKEASGQDARAPRPTPSHPGSAGVLARSGRIGLTPLLAVRGLTVDYDGGELPAVAGVVLEIGRGEALGLLGESGCGKTSLALALLGLLPAEARVSGRVALDGDVPGDGLSGDVADIPEQVWRRIRGERIGAVFQQPSQALSPYRRVGRQIRDVLRAHGRGRRESRERVAELLAEVGLEPDVGRAHPHQLSGGQRQRVVLCQALACEPDLLLADEPTASLDGDTEERILALVDRIRRERDLALLWISHDPAVHERLAERLLVMYGGTIIEDGPARSVLERPAHPYTAALLACRPEEGRSGRMKTLPDGPLAAVGCPYRPRCPRAVDECREPQPWRPVGEDRRVRCVRPLEESGG